MQKERKLSLAENFSKEVLCANRGLKEKYSTLLKLLREQGRQCCQWLFIPPGTNGSLHNQPGQTSCYTPDICPYALRLPWVSGSCLWCNLKGLREIVPKFFRQSA